MTDYRESESESKLVEGFAVSPTHLYSGIGLIVGLAVFLMVYDSLPYNYKMR